MQWQREEAMATLIDGKEVLAVIYRSEKEKCWIAISAKTEKAIVRRQLLRDCKEATERFFGGHVEEVTSGEIISPEEIEEGSLGCLN